MWRFLMILCLVPSSVLALVPRKVQGVEQTGPSSRITVYYVTDRKATADKPPLSPYGTERSKDLTYGTAHVSVPPNHTRGVMEEPSRW
jgi:esterase/lipase superfamily enzyme